MNTVLSWVESEPVLSRVGPVVLLTVGYFVTRGWIDGSTADFLLAVASVIIGGGGIASARSAVTPVVKLTHLPPAADDQPGGRYAE